MIDQTEVPVDSFEGPIHVSFKAVKNTAPSAKYKLQVGGYQFVKSVEKGTPGVSVQLKFDPATHKEHEKRTIFERFWFTPNAMNLYLAFLVACKINPELLREVPVEPPKFNPDGSPVTRCAYSVDDQLKAVFGAMVYGDVEEEMYEGVAADGVTPENKWRNKVATRGFSKV